MKKKYESIRNTSFIVFLLKDDNNWVVIKDIINDCIICSKHVNYINKIGLQIKTPYMAAFGSYTNSKGYPEYDIVGDVSSYVPLQNNLQFYQVDKSSKSKTKISKPAWIK